MKSWKLLNALLLILALSFLTYGCTAPTSKNITSSEEGTATDTTNYENTADDNKRWLIFGIWNFNITPQDELETAVQEALANGFNAIRIHIPWFHVEKKAGVYDFTEFDKQLDYLVGKLGVKVVITVDFTRKADEDSVISSDELQYDNKGVICSGGAFFDRTMISFASKTAVKKADDFYSALCENVIGKYKENILLISPVFSQYAESEYWCTGKYDYSDNAVEGFKDFLKARYSDIASLNGIISADYSDFSEVIPPDDFNGGMGLLWYQYRHTALKSFIDGLCDIQNAIDKDVKLGLQFGSVFDEASVLRGTIAFSDLMEKADVMWVDDGPKYDHNWSMDYIGSVLKPEGKQTANEIDGYYHIQNGVCTIEDYLSQGIQSFTHGADYITVANWTVNLDFFDNKKVFQDIGKLTGQDAQVLQITPDSPILEVSLYDIFTKRSSTNYIKQYNKLTENGNVSCNIKVTDDLTKREPEKDILSFSFPASFSDTEPQQGCFSYHSFDPKTGTFGSMKWSSEYNAWQGDAEFCLVGSNMMHPDNLDSAVVFTAPQDGKIAMSFTASVTDTVNSDGVIISVLHNGVNIYPEKLVTIDILEADLTADVKKGDEIALICNKNKVNSFDSTGVSIDINYN